MKDNFNGIFLLNGSINFTFIAPVVIFMVPFDVAERFSFELLLKFGSLTLRSMKSEKNDEKLENKNWNFKLLRGQLAYLFHLKGKFVYLQIYLCRCLFVQPSAFNIDLTYVFKALGSDTVQHCQ